MGGRGYTREEDEAIVNAFSTYSLPLNRMDYFNNVIPFSERDYANIESRHKVLVAEGRVTSTGDDLVIFRAKALKRAIDEVDSIECLEQLGKRIKSTFEAIEGRIEYLKEEKKKMEDPTPAGCCVCMDDICKESVMVTKCGHVMCAGCTVKLLLKPMTFYGQRLHRCPMCRSELGSVKEHNSEEYIYNLPVGSTLGDVYKFLKAV